MTFAFSTEQTRLPRFRASSKPTRATRTISRGRIDLGVDAAALAVGQGLDAARAPEIDAAGQLAQDHEVEAPDQLGLERGAVGERIEHLGRPEVGEQAQLLAQAQEAALGLLIERQRVVFGPADRAEQHRIRAPAPGP